MEGLGRRSVSDFIVDRNTVRDRGRPFRVASRAVPVSDADTDTKPLSTREALAVYMERSTLVMMALGFAAGLPFLLIFDTLSAWLRDVGLSLEVIGFFSLATLVYSFKFLWAPLVDRTRVPWLTAWLGHRRSWMLVCQAVIIVGLWLVAGSEPRERAWPDGGVRRAGRFFVGHAGHRDRRLAHRGGRRVSVRAPWPRPTSGATASR